MKKRKVTFAAFQSAITAPGAFGGDISLSITKQKGIEMFVGLEPNMLTVFYHGMEVGIPYMNVKDIMYEESSTDQRLSA